MSELVKNLRCYYIPVSFFNVEAYFCCKMEHKCYQLFFTLQDMIYISFYIKVSNFWKQLGKYFILEAVSLIWENNRENKLGYRFLDKTKALITMILQIA